jgi:hypothetical protein
MIKGKVVNTLVLTLLNLFKVLKTRNLQSDRPLGLLYNFQVDFWELVGWVEVFDGKISSLHLSLIIPVK